MAATEPVKKSSETSPSPARAVPNFFVSLSSAFLKIPLARPTKPNLLLLPPACESSNVIHDLHRSLVKATEKFSGFVHSLASRNPLFQKAVLLSSELQALCHEIRSKNPKMVRLQLSNHGFAAVLPGDSVAGMVVANGLMNFFNIYNSLLVVRLVLTWFPNTPPAIVSPLSTICDPYLNIFRGIIPPLGGTLDLSPILAFLVLNAFTSTAAALPCELPPAEGGPSSHETKQSERFLNRFLLGQNRGN
ncbi:PREDICTED: ylmG homolog protein 2, chloroplastic [Tarenaya hassleriana]|uniref:ylmG homolog protein 2, chloroplastic n=1 Tax=Tarenaya hassleriana TaxID=28532 RepID=UPI00053C26B5|nr:PREDICTED: ylmG homolog protein 2, chloroplastic [Tarenaya hassleriana]